MITGVDYYPDGSPARVQYGNDLITDYQQIYEAGIPIRAITYGRDTTFLANRSVYLYSGATLGNNPVWYEKYLDYPTGEKKSIDNFNNPHKVTYQQSNGVSYRATLAYDRESRLTSADYSLQPSGQFLADLDYQYDKLGNRTSQTGEIDVGGDDLDHTYDLLSNRLASSTPLGAEAAEPYTYDAAGNQLVSPEHRFTFDFLGRLIDADSGRVHFYYSSSDQKLIRLAPTDLTFYFYDPAGDLIYEQTRDRATGAPKHDTYYIHALGQTISYLSSGGITPTFIDREYDPDLGLYYLNARWYNPTLGRFISVDPIPGSLNQYAYAGNNPFRFEDADGMLFGPKKINMFQKRREIITDSPEFHYAPEIESALCLNCSPSEQIAWQLNIVRCNPITPWGGQCISSRAMIYLEDEREIPISDFLITADSTLTVGTPGIPDEAIPALMLGGLRMERNAGKLAKIAEEAEEIASISARTKTGQIHHWVSTRVWRALERHKVLRGIFSRRDPRYVSQAVDRQSHWGYQIWHRLYDFRTELWLFKNRNATEGEFINYVNSYKKRPDIVKRFGKTEPF